MFPLSEKSKVLVLIKKKKKHAEVAKIYRKNKSSIHEIVKNEKEIHICFGLTPHTAKVMVIAYDKHFSKMEKALNLFSKIF